MTDHLSSETIELLTQKQLAPPDLLVATRHLSVCEECRSTIGEKAEIVSRMQYFVADMRGSVDSTSHPEYEQFEAYVDGLLTAGDRDSLRQHLTSCDACMYEVREIESLRDGLNINSEGVVESNLPAQQRESFWSGIVGLFQLRTARLAFLAAVVLLIVAAVVVLIRRSPAPEIVNRNQAPVNREDANQNSEFAGANNNSININQPVPNKREEVVDNSQYQSIIDRTIETQRLVTPPVIADLAGHESKLLGPSEKEQRFALSSPKSTIVRSDRPTLRWQQLAGATSYSVSILDSDLNIVEQSNPTTNLSWVPQHALKRNVVYIWQVVAVKDGKEITAPSAPAAEARFKVLAQDKATTLSRNTSDLKDSHLKLGIVYAHEGLLDDAESEFQAAIKANDNPDLARKLLRGIPQMRR